MKDNNSDDAVRIKLDLVEIRVNLRHAEAKILEKTQELEKVHANFSQRDGELKRTIQELNNLNTIYEVTKEKLKQAESKISQKEKKVAKKKTTARLQAILASMLFLLSSVLASFGVNNLTSVSPNSAGWIMIALAIVTYISAAFISISATTEGSDS